MSRNKKIILIVVVMITIGAAVGYQVWNKPHENIKDATAIKISANELYKSYLHDSVASGKRYTNRVVEVSGVVAQVSPNQQKQMVILLKSPSEGGYINCTMEEDPGDVRPGKPVVIKGMCNGYNALDADMGIPGDVVIVRGYKIDG